MEALFLSAVVLLSYVFIGYPLLILLVSHFVARPVRKRDIEPTISFLISAYNEEKMIRAKIENTLSLDYPKSLMEIMVVSDGSTDGTDGIVMEYAADGVELFRVEGRVGKTEARNRAVARATGEIVIFSDTDSLFLPGAPRALVANFADESVGMVSGHCIFENKPNSPSGPLSMLFWDYENFIKTRQNQIGTLTGAVGNIAAIRRGVYEPLPADIIDELAEPLMMIRKGYRVVFEREARAPVSVTKNLSAEFAMRTRVISGGMRALWYMRDVLNPFRYPWVSFQILSHKIARWAVPLLLALLLLANISLLGEGFYLATLVGQLAFYLLAAFGGLCARFGCKAQMLSMPYHFVLGNVAVVRAFLQVIQGYRETGWRPAR